MYMYKYTWKKNAPAMPSFLVLLHGGSNLLYDLYFVISSMVLFFNHTPILKVFEYFYISNTIWSQ